MPTPSTPAPVQGVEEVESLTHGERWFLDGFSVMQMPGGFVCRQVDMSTAKRVLSALREAGLAATFNHVVVRALALALHRNPHAHKLVCGYRRVQPSRVDIGLSVAGQTSYAPVLIIEDAASKPLPELVQFVKDSVPKIRGKELRDLEGMKKNGWLVPIGWLRRMILRLLNRSFWFRRKLVGTFQVTCLPVDFGVPLMFYTGAALCVGAVRDRVIAVSGQAEVRPTVLLSMAFDHKTLDGKSTTELLAAMCDILESEELWNEVSAMPHIEAATTPLAPPEFSAEPLTIASVGAGG